MANKVNSEITKLFIANRGEITRRIALSAKRLGIQTCSILGYNEAPKQYLIGLIDDFAILNKDQEENTALYLNQEFIIATALKNNCDAIHPGFGFLSENAGFARKVHQAGLLWIGPSALNIETMAEKARARILAENCSVPVLTGLNDLFVSGMDSVEAKEKDLKKLVNFAKNSGFPLILKAAFGGGGKGMRIVNSFEELEENAIRAASEALNSFGNSTLICERYIASSRHIEVQIVADNYGECYAVGDRDCSIQRRHQKIIEEAPAPFISTELRSKLHNAAVNISKHVNYNSAGTVEFLLDWDIKKQVAKGFYFLEMNTRLQVEHPVSEEVYSIDLVEWQLLAAKGVNLSSFINPSRVQESSFKQTNVHSIEIRLYAEDPEQNFIPTPGDIVAFIEPSGPGIRIEKGLDNIDKITGSFDPMIAKIIATATTRNAAIQRMTQALRTCFFAGPKTNIELLSYIFKSDTFISRSQDSLFLAKILEKLLADIVQQKQKLQKYTNTCFKLLAAGEVLASNEIQNSLSLEQISRSAFSKEDSVLHDNSQESKIWQVVSNKVIGKNQDKKQIQSGVCWDLANTEFNYFWFAKLATADSTKLWLKIADLIYSTTIQNSKTESSNTNTDNENVLISPVPGKIIAIKVIEGDQVKKEQTIFILESMKMEFEVVASKDAEIAEIYAKIDSQVDSGAVLASYK